MPLWSSVWKVVDKFIIKPIIQKGVDFMVTKIQTMLLAILGSIIGAEDHGGHSWLGDTMIAWDTCPEIYGGSIPPSANSFY